MSERGLVWNKLRSLNKDFTIEKLAILAERVIYVTNIFNYEKQLCCDSHSAPCTVTFGFFGI